MTSPIRCAVIGLGMGRGHADAYAACPDAKLVAVCDQDPKKLEVWAGSLGAGHCHSDWKKLLREEKPDLVSVALPNALHAPVTIAALESGAHVLCEKPMAMDLAAAKRMDAAARKAKRKLGLNLSFRFTPQARALRDLAAAGALGEVYHARTWWTRRDSFPGFGGWFGQKALAGGGPLIDLGVHRIDLALWLMGGPKPITVSGTTHSRIGIPRATIANKAFDVEDFATGFVRFDNGASLIFEASWAGHQDEDNRMATTVIGTKAALVHRNHPGTFNFVAEMLSTDPTGHQLTTTVTPRGDLPNPYASMVRAVREDTAPLADAADGLRIQAILDGLYRSAATGREVKLG